MVHPIYLGFCEKGKMGSCRLLRCGYPRLPPLQKPRPGGGSTEIDWPADLLRCKNGFLGRCRLLGCGYPELSTLHQAVQTSLRWVPEPGDFAPPEHPVMNARPVYLGFYDRGFFGRCERHGCGYPRTVDFAPDCADGTAVGTRTWGLCTGQYRRTRSGYPDLETPHSSVRTSPAWAPGPVDFALVCADQLGVGTRTRRPCTE